MSGPRRSAVAGAVSVAALVGAAAIARRTERRWERAHDPSPVSDYLLPVGRAVTVTTDDGAELAVTVAGPSDAAETYVLAHGWACGREVWAPVAHRLLAIGAQVVLYDQRGHQSSTLGADEVTVERLGRDCLAVVEQLDLRDVVLGGHSMGGMTVLAAAVHGGDVVRSRVRGLAVVSSAGAGIGDIGNDARTAAFVASKVVDGALTSPLGRFFVRGAVGKRVVAARHLDLTKDLFVALPGPVRVSCLEAMLAMDLRHGLPSVDLPSVVVIGSEDKLIRVSRARETAELLGADFVLLEDFGHMLPLESPDVVTDRLVALRTEVSASVAG